MFNHIGKHRGETEKGNASQKTKTKERKGYTCCRENIGNFRGEKLKKKWEKELQGDQGAVTFRETKKNWAAPRSTELHAHLPPLEGISQKKTHKDGSIIRGEAPIVVNRSDSNTQHWKKS